MDINQFKKELDKCVESLVEDLSQIRTGRATPELIQDVIVKAYETEAPLKNYATINVSDAKSLLIIPWDKTIIDNIVKGITSSNLGFSSVVEGEHIRVSMPDLTEERRKDYVRVMKERVEDARVAVRQIRQKYRQEIDEALKGSFSEDEADRLREEIDKIVKDKNSEIEEIKEKKETDLMTI